MEERLIPEDELIKARVEKLDLMKQLGKDPFAIERYERYASVKKDDEEKKIEPFSTDVMAVYEENEPKDDSPSDFGMNVSMAGRIVSLRIMGKAAFAHIQDRKGKIQVYFRKDDLGEAHEMVKLLDLGDFVGVTGYIFRTRTGEISIHAKELTVLS